MTEQDKLTRFATVIKDGKLGIDLLYCLEFKKFFVYRDNFWQFIFEREIDIKIIEYPEWKHLTVDQRNKIIENLKSLVQVRQDQFNKLGYLNFDSGEFDPSYKKPFSNPAGAWHPHKKEHLSTLRMPYPSTIGLDCPLWKKTLNEIFEGDADKIRTLQEFFGYCLTRDTRKEKSLLLLGDSRTGKSTILETLSYMIGQENCSFVSLDYIFHPQYSPLLMNKLVNIDTDVSAKAENYEREFKTITSGEPITCNQKFVETFKFRPYCKLVMAANEFPKIKDHSSAFYKRLILLPCERVFEEKEQDIHLKDKLMEELYAIFEWACEGLERLNERGAFEKKPFMKSAIEELEDDNNPINGFIKDHIYLDKTEKENIDIEKAELYGKFKIWCKENQPEGYVVSKALFGKIIYAKFSKYTPKHYQKASTGKRYWKNIKYVENKYIVEVKGEQLAWND